MFQRPARPLFAQLRSLSIYQRSNTLRSECTQYTPTRLAQTTINRIETTRKFSTENEKPPKDEVDDTSVEGQKAYLEMLQANQVEPLSKYQLNLLKEKEEAAKKTNDEEEPHWKKRIAHKRQKNLDAVMETSKWTYRSPGSQYNGLKLSDFIKIAEYRNINFNPRITGEKFVTKIESDDSWRRKLGQPWGLKASPFSKRTGPRTKWAPREEDRDNKDESSESSERPSNGNFFEGRRYDTGLPARPRHSTGFPDREGSERSFDRPERPHSAYRQEDSGPRELNPELQSSDGREYNSDRPPREGFNSDRPPRREYNSDRPYTPRDFNSDRPQHYPSRDFSRPAYDPTNRPSYNSDRPSKYFSPNSSRPYDSSSGERSLNRTSNPNSSERSLKLSSSPPSSDSDSSSAAQGSQSSQDGSNPSPSESSERTPQLDPRQRFSYQGTGQRSYPPHRPNPYARDFPDGQLKKPWSPMVRPLPRGLQKWQKHELAWTPRGEWRDKMDRYKGDKDRGYGGDRDRRDRKKGEWKF